MGRFSLPSPNDPFLRRLRRTLHEKALVREGQTVLVAASGGADSTALLVALTVLAGEEGIGLRVGHVNHKLRGAESDADGEWVGELAERLGWPFHLAVADVPALRRTRRGSVEEVARSARRQSLEAIRWKTGADLLATAHHLDDQAETVLFHLLRGSGLTGLAGMSWGPDGGTIRPFLGTRRSEIRDALGLWGISWREDSSNESLDMARNRLRHVLIPVLEREWNPQIVPALARLADVVSTDEAALEEMVERAWSEVLTVQTQEMIILDKTAIRSYPLGIRRRLIRRAAQSLPTVVAPPSYAETLRLTALADRLGAVVLRGRVNAWSTKAEISFEAADAWYGPTAVSMDGETYLPGWGTLRVRCVESEVQPEGGEAGSVVVLPRAMLGWPLVVRRWRKGDRIAQRGNKTASLADIARRRRPPLDPRRFVLVADPHRIVWVPELSAVAAPSSSGDQRASHGAEAWLLFEWKREDDARPTASR